MSIFLSLLKTTLNVNYGISALKYRFTKEKKRIWEPVLIGLSAIIGVSSLVTMFGAFLYAVFIGGQSINHPEMVITFGYMASQIVVFIFGIFYIMSAFYFSKDLNILVPLPLKPSYVLGSKFLVVMINEYFTLLPVLLPAIIIYGVGMSQGPAYWFKGIVLIFAAPAIPLIIGALFIMILMRFVNIRRSKDLLAVLGGVFGLFIALGVNFFVQKLPKGSEQEFLKNILSTQSGIVETIGRSFPPSIWATFGLTQPGLVGISYFLLFIGISILLFILLLWFGNRVFYRSLLSGQEVSRKKRVISREQTEKYYNTSSNPVMAIFLREWKVFMRTPVFVMNGLAGMIVGPFFAIMPFISNNNADFNLFSIIRNNAYVLPVTLAGLALMLFTAGMNIVACTSISREGQTFWISKMIPVAPKYQLAAKVLHGVAVSAIGIVVTGIVLIIMINFSILRVVVLFILGLLGAFLMVIYNLIIDMLRPKLEWTNPQEAVKQNLNALFGILATFFLLIILSILAVLMIVAGLPECLVYILLGLCMIILSIPGVILISGLAEQRYRSIEV